TRECDAVTQRQRHRTGRRVDGLAVLAGDGDHPAVIGDSGLGIRRRPFLRRMARVADARGYTLGEMLVVATIILILASAVMPLAKVQAQRTRAAELRRSLREIRTAIDKFKDAADTGQIGTLDIKVGSENYPPDLETLVEGVSAANDATGRKLKYLRHVPT